MQKTVSVSFLVFLLAQTAQTASADSPMPFTPMPYMGAQLGFADVHQGEFIERHLDRIVRKFFPQQSTHKMNIFFTNTGLAGRVFAGYQFTPYFALEIGYYRFKSFDIKAGAHVSTNVDVGVNAVFKKYVRPYGQYHIVLPLDFSAKATMNTNVIDLTTKLILPLKSNFSVYAKLGLAYVNADARIDLNINVDPFKIGISSNPSLNLVCPEFGVGVDYKMSEHFSTDFSWLHVQKYNGNSFPNIDVAALGLLYHF